MFRRELGRSPGVRFLPHFVSTAAILLYCLPAPGSSFVRDSVLRTDATVNAIAFSRDGRLLATGHNNQVVKFWSLPGAQSLQTLKGHGGKVLSVAFSPDGRSLRAAARTRA